jgi:hypothetical protein
VPTVSFIHTFTHYVCSVFVFSYSHISIYYLSLLCLIDPRNYTTEKIEKDKTDVLSFIYQLLQETVTSKLEALVEESREQDQTVFEQLEIVDDNEYDGDVITQLLRKVNESRRLNIDEDQKRKELEDNLKGEIQREIDQYMIYCSTTTLDSLLKNHPTEFYVKELQQELKDKEFNIPIPKVNRGMPSYVAPRFDVLHWWLHVGKLLYPKLGTGAPIILGKPTHNGYQERVFSIGKYCDSTLRNRMRPENFEMRVLDTVNKQGDGIEEFTKLANTQADCKYVKEFFTSQNLKLILKQPSKSIDNNNNLDNEIEEVPLDPQFKTTQILHNPKPQFADDDEEDDDLDNPFAST